jgi:hypothetical protein
MPKRWRIAKGSSWTWRYVDTDFKPPKVLAQSNERWESKKDVRDEIEAMKRNKEIDEEDDE